MLATEAVVCPHLIGAEVVHALRSQVMRGQVEAVAAVRMLTVWQRLGLERVDVARLLDRVWELRYNLSAYNATYVAVAETFDVALVTADARLAQAPGPRCTVVVVRR